MTQDLSRHEELVSDLRTQAADGEDRIAALQAELQATQAKLRDAESRAGALEWELASATAKAAEAGMATVNAERALEASQRHSAQVSALQARVAELEAALAAAQQATKASTDAQKQLRVLAEATEARLKAEEAERRLAQDDANKARRTAEQWQGKLKDKQAQVEELCNELHTTKRESNRIEEEMQRLTRAADEHKESLRRRSSEANEALAHIGVLEAKLMAADAEVIKARKASRDAKRIAEAEALERVRVRVGRSC